MHFKVAFRKIKLACDIYNYISFFHALSLDIVKKEITDPYSNNAVSDDRSFRVPILNTC